MRNFFNTETGRYVGSGISALGVLALGWIVIAWAGDSPASRSADRIFVDAHTGQPFGYELRKEETIPVPSPHSEGQRVGYEAEPCYWTADGAVKSEPTWVLPMVKVDPGAGPTFCGDCGRLVRPRNPEPVPGAKPPPTQAEYKPSPRGRGEEAPEAYTEMNR